MNRQKLKLLVHALVTFLLVAAGHSAQAPKAGGILNATLIEAPPSFSIHDEATISTVWPMMSCYNNLMLFDPLKKQESLDTIIPELPEKWWWQDAGRGWALSWGRMVRWQEGHPFPSTALKRTSDTVPAGKVGTSKLRLNH